MEPVDPLLLEAPRVQLSTGSTTRRLGHAIAEGAERRIYGPLRRTLSKPKGGRLVVGLAMVLVSTSLFCGIAADDHIHRLILRGSPDIAGFQRSPLDLFRFATPEFNRALMEQGIFPWWADPAALLAFFRPLTSLSHAVDHWLFGDSSFFAHLQSVGWFFLALVGVRKLYADMVESRWMALLGVIFYSLDDARSGPLTWLANRNALIASALSIWALYCYVRWRHGAFKAGAWLGPLIFAVSLTAAEGAIAICGYLVAYAFLLDDGSWAKRATRLLPYLVIVVAWRVLTASLNYGSMGSGVYLDPAREPLAYFSALPVRLCALMLGQLAGPWSEMWNAAAIISVTIERVLLAIAAIVLLIVVLLVRPLWAADKKLQFWIVGAVLAAFPPCATFPADRLLNWISIGAAAATGIVFCRLTERRKSELIWRGPVLFGQFAALSIVAFHLLIGPLTLPWRSTGIIAIRSMLERADKSLPETPEIRKQTFIYVNPPGDALASYVPIMRADEGRPFPQKQRWLGVGNTELHLERVDERTLRLEQVGGYVATPSERMLRGVKNPFKLGEEVVLSGLRVQVTRLTEDQRPLEVMARFDVPLEDASLRWFAWVEDRYEPFALPKVGEKRTMPPADWLKVAYGAD